MTRDGVRRLDQSVEVLARIAQGIGGDIRRLDCLVRGFEGNWNPDNSATLVLGLLCDLTCACELITSIAAQTDLVQAFPIS